MFLGGKSSQENSVSARDRQGSILGTTLFLLYIFLLYMTFLKMLCVTLLSMLMILLSIVSVIRHVICGNN